MSRLTDKRKIIDFTICCPKYGAEATWIEDNTLGLKFLDWTCQKCGAQILNIGSKNND